MRGLVLALLFIPATFGQDETRTFHLTDFSSAGTAQEIVTALRGLAGIPQATFDGPSANLIARGTPGQLSVAEWLIPKVDVPPDLMGDPQRYEVAGNRNDILEVAPLKNAAAYGVLQEMLNTLRTVGEISLVYPVSTPRILVFRGDKSQIALAEFLITELDQPDQPRKEPTIRKFQIPGGDAVIVYGLVHAGTASRMQNITNNLRTVLGVFKESRGISAKILVVRGSANVIRMVEWLIPKLDTQTPAAEGNETTIPNSLDDLIHVFYLKHQINIVAVSRVYEAVRAAPDMSKTFFYSLSPPAIVVRGSASQIATANGIITAADQ